VVLRFDPQPRGYEPDRIIALVFGQSIFHEFSAAEPEPSAASFVKPASGTFAV
jgi:hypothetical protein